MKIFWSWQSDLPGKISRHFVRKALMNAVKSLNEEHDIQEPDRQVTLDHDRKGIPGSPDLASLIFQKIENCDVFVADVTPVGVSTTNQENIDQKKFMNSNVAIELGYFLKATGDRNLIMVMNEAYGKRQDLPFDLRHKAGPIFYNLNQNANKDEIDQELKKLSGKLKVALSEILPTLYPQTPPFQRCNSIENDPGRYFLPQKPLVIRTSRFENEPTQYLVSDEALYYLRIIPDRHTRELSRSEAIELIKKGPVHLNPFDYDRSGSSFDSNEFGAISFEADYEKNLITSAAQLFLSREIWAFGNNYLSGKSSRNEKIGIPSLVFEKNFTLMLPQYLKFMTEKCEIEPPFIIEAGITGIKDNYIFLPRRTEWGPILQDNIKWTDTIKSIDPEEVDKVLLGIFRAVYDAAAKERPEDLYGFPGQTPGTIPNTQYPIANSQ
ncbi:MAG: hypothetical protein ACRBBN_15280 [Methyloligellaceae bacterium]